MAAHRCALEAVSALAAKQAAGTPVRFEGAVPASAGPTFHVQADGAGG